MRIEDYGLLSDCRSAALVGRDGSVDWWCPPRFDAPSVFGRLLDPDAGHWSIRPAGPCRTTREYRAGSLVLRTRFETPDGAVTVTDALALEAGVRGHDLGHGSPRALLRLVEGCRGAVPMRVEYRPRPEYGRIRPYL